MAENETSNAVSDRMMSRQNLHKGGSTNMQGWIKRNEK